MNRDEIRARWTPLLGPDTKWTMRQAAEEVVGLLDALDAAEAERDAQHAVTVFQEDQIGHLRAERDALLYAVHGENTEPYSPAAFLGIESVRALQAREESLRAALAFYADSANHEAVIPSAYGNYSAVDADGGACAFAALAALPIESPADADFDEELVARLLDPTEGDIIAGRESP